jgi:hypothetical protein
MRSFSTLRVNERFKSKGSMKNKLLIVTDLGLFRAYRADLTPKHTPHLELIEEFMFVEAHRRFDELVTDMAGRHVGPTHAAWGAPMTDDHNLRLETERRIIKRIAKHIEDLVQRNGHDGCWLAAPKPINHQILEELPPAVRSRIEKNLPRDLTKAGEKELLEHFVSS